MTVFESRFERLERKYLIDEPTAESIRRYVSPYCEPDPHNPAVSGFAERPFQRGYRIHSLYLDSPGLAFHKAKERGDPDRVKLRVRTYGDHSPAVMEIKRRYSEVTDKKRAVVSRKVVERAVRGMVQPDTDDPQMARHLDEFALIAAQVGVVPTLHVRYEREAYRSLVDEYARVTMDRHIEVQRASGWSTPPDPDGWIEFDHYWRPELGVETVVLEIKCQSQMPWWLCELVRDHSLTRRSFSKYSIGIYLTHHVEGGHEVPARSSKVMV